MSLPWVIVLAVFVWILATERASERRRALARARRGEPNQIDLALKHQLVTGSLGNTRRNTASRGPDTVDTTPPETAVDPKLSGVGVPAPLRIVDFTKLASHACFDPKCRCSEFDRVDSQLRSVTEKKS